MAYNRPSIVSGVTRLDKALFDSILDGVDEKLSTTDANATYVPAKSEYAAVHAMLAEPTLSWGIGIVGDSTGNGPDEWPQFFLSAIAPSYPSLTFQEVGWSNISEWINRPTVIQTGAAGVRYAQFTGTGNNTSSYLAPASITGDLDIRVAVAPDAWTGAVDQCVVAKFGSGGARAFRANITSNGRMSFDWTTDGSTIQTVATSSVVIPGIAGQKLFLRYVLDVDNGASGHDIKFYTSTDGSTWTQLGTTITRAGVTSLFAAASTEYEIGGRGAVAEPFKGKYYEVQVRDGIDGPTVTPILPEHWRANNTTTTVAGAPIFTLVNSSHPGANIAFLNNATRRRKMVANYGQIAVILSTSHNEGSLTGSSVLTAVTDWATAVDVLIPGMQHVIVTQNPRIAPADRGPEQATRRAQYLAYARNKGWSALDTYQAFKSAPDVAALLNVDGFHPNLAGEKLWANEVLRFMGFTERVS